MQVSMSNQKSTESAIKNLEVQVGQLAKQLADWPSSNFGANTEKNPNEECKDVMTRSKMATMVDEKKVGQRVVEEKQQLVTKLALEPEDEVCELEEEEGENNNCRWERNQEKSNKKHKKLLQLNINRVMG